MAARKGNKHRGDQGKKVDRDLFASEWVRLRDLGKAYVAAGGGNGPGSRQAGYRLMQEPEVKEKVAEITRQLLERSQVNAERTLMELARVGYADMRKLFDPNTGAPLAPHQLDDDTAAAVAGFDIEERIAPDGTITRTTKIRRSDKNQALGVLARHQKLVGSDMDETIGAALAITERMEKARERLRRMRKAP